MSLRATNMSIEEQRAWEEMARSGELANYLKSHETGENHDYARALARKVAHRRRAATTRNAEDQAHLEGRA